MGGVVVSILQFRLLRSYTDVTSQWILFSVTGWCFPVLMLVSMDYIKLVIHQNLILFFYNLTMILCGGLVLGLCTGKILLKILRTKFKEV